MHQATCPTSRTHLTYPREHSKAAAAKLKAALDVAAAKWQALEKTAAAKKALEFKAEKWQALEVRREMLGNRHPDTLLPINGLGLLLKLLRLVCIT